VIQQIRFEGNAVTQEAVMRQEMIITEGDAVSLPRIEESAQNIMNLGLFERVSYLIEPAGADENIVLIIIVIERHYIIPLPTAKLNSDSEVEYGVKLRWNNVWGMNHRLRWDLINKSSELGVRQYENNIQYRMPRIFASRYELSLLSNNTVQVDDDPVNGSQKQSSYALGFDVLKWLSDDGVSKGLFAAAGLGYNQKKISALDAPLTIADERVTAVIYSARLGYDKIQEFEFNRTGARLEYRVDFSVDDMSAANTDFVRHEISYTHLHAFKRRPPENFNYIIAIGSANADVLGDKAFSIGGNTNLRGYETGAYRGNAMLRVNLEYLTVLGDSPTLRKVYFMDFGDTPEELSELRLSTLKTGVGAGIRWKVRRFVDLDVRLDLAYGVETGEFRVGLGTRNTF
jgi:outer membrane protein assembly factor BamA